MKTILNALLVGLLALVVLQSVGKGVAPGPKPVAEIQLTDSGDVTLEKYLAIYRANLKAKAAEFNVRRKAKEFKDSFEAVKAWSEMSRAARESASHGVDKRIAKLVTADEESQDRWIEEFAR